LFLGVASLKLPFVWRVRASNMAQVDDAMPQGGAAQAARPRWQLNGVSTQRLFDEGVLFLHARLLAAGGEELPPRDQASPAAPRESGIDSLMSGRLELKDMHGGDVREAEGDLGFLTFRQLVAIRARCLAPLPGTPRHRAHNSFLASLDGYLHEVLACRAVRLAGHATEVTIVRDFGALGQLLLHLLGAARLFQGECARPSMGCGGDADSGAGVGVPRAALPALWVVRVALGDPAVDCTAVFNIEDLKLDLVRAGNVSGFAHCVGDTPVAIVTECGSLASQLAPGVPRRSSSCQTIGGVAGDGTLQERRVSWEVVAYDPLQGDDISAALAQQGHDGRQSADANLRRMSCPSLPRPEQLGGDMPMAMGYARPLMGTELRGVILKLKSWAQLPEPDNKPLQRTPPPVRSWDPVASRISVWESRTFPRVLTMSVDGTGTISPGMASARVSRRRSVDVLPAEPETPSETSFWRVCMCGLAGGR